MKKEFSYSKFKGPLMYNYLLCNVSGNFYFKNKYLQGASRYKTKKATPLSVGETALNINNKWGIIFKKQVSETHKTLDSDSLARLSHQHVAERQGTRASLSIRIVMLNKGWAAQQSPGACPSEMTDPTLCGWERWSPSRHHQPFAVWLYRGKASATVCTGLLLRCRNTLRVHS